MTDAEKLADYERVVQIIKDQIALETHMRGKKAKYEAIEFIRADAYEHIVHRVIGLDAFRDAYHAEPTAPPNPPRRRRRSSTATKNKARPRPTKR